jgi:predicted SnoaL-like aldol condensation-catalyzing enzyme
MTRDHIQQVLDTIFKRVFDQGQADLMPGLVSGPYIQHNPLFPNGLEGIMGYIKQAGRIPCEVKRVAIDGNLAFVHVRYLEWGGKETAGVDIFRFDAEEQTGLADAEGLSSIFGRPAFHRGDGLRARLSDRSSELAGRAPRYSHPGSEYLGRP